MLDLQKDLYVRLAISARKNRELNKPFKVVHVDMPYIPLPKNVNKSDTSLLKNIEMPSKFDKVVANIPLPTATPAVAAKPRSIEKIDEKVEKIISDPVLLEIKAELEFAEALLQKIKSVDKHNAKIPAIEQTVVQLKMALNQKMYV